jgi:hypothetical protein
MRFYFVMTSIALGALGWLMSWGGDMKSRRAFSVVEEPKRIVFRWSGTVEPPMLREFSSAYSRYQSDRRPILISLNSPGGSVKHGADVIDLIERMKRTHPVDTVVEKGSTCASMCVPIYLTGTWRNAHPKARFMFHEVSLRLPAFAPLTDRVLVSAMGKSLIPALTDRFFEKQMEATATGLNLKWLNGIREEIRNGDVWRTGDQLVKERSGIVNRLQQ